MSPSENVFLMSTKLLSPLVEPDFWLPNIKVYPMSRTTWTFHLEHRKAIWYTVNAFPHGRIGQRWGATWAPVWVYKGGGTAGAAFLIASLETKAINLGVWGSAPPLCLAFWLWYGQWIDAGSQISVILAGCQLSQIPLIPVVVVIICPVRNGSEDIVKGFTPTQVDFIFHVTKEGFLWRVIPAVCFPGHWLP